MNRLRRRSLAALLGTGLLLVACGGPAGTTPTPGQPTDTPAEAPTPEPTDDEEQVTISYFTFSAAPDHLDDLDTIIEAFNLEHPNITIDVQTAPFDEYFTRLQTQIAGGTAPDTFELNYENFVTYAAADTLLDLTPMAAADADRYYPRAYEVFSIDGNQYGLPATFSNVLLFYNKDLFDAAGVDYPSADWTWEDELAAAEALTDSDAEVWGVFQPVQFWEFYKVLAQNGGEFFSEDGSEVRFNSPEGVEAAEWLIDKVGHVMPTEAQMGGQDDGALFASGQLAMWHTGIWMFSGLADAPFEWDVSVEPGSATKGHHFFANAAVASSTTEHPEAAWHWIQFLTGSDAAVETRIAASWELAAVADLSLFEPYLAQTPPENREAVFEALDHVVVPPVIEQQAQMQDILNEHLERAKLGEVSAQEALDAAAEQVAALLP